MLKEIIRKLREKKERFTQAEEEVLIQKKIERKNKSFYEKELEDIMEKRRQEAIKQAVINNRRLENHKMLHDNHFLKQKNIFSNKQTIRLTGSNLL